MDINYSYFNTAKGYKVVGGTAAQFLKADGSVDSNTYLNQTVANSNFATIQNTGGTAKRTVCINSALYSTTGIHRIYLGVSGLTGYLKVKITSIFAGSNVAGFIELAGGIGVNSGIFHFNGLPCITSSGNIRYGYYVDPVLKYDSVTGFIYIEIHKKTAPDGFLYVEIESNSAYLLSNPIVLSQSFDPAATPSNLINEVDFQGPISAQSFSKSGGTAAQFLKADGSVDSNAYLPLSGGTITGNLNITGYVTAKSILRVGDGNNDQRVHHKVYNSSIAASQTGVLSLSITAPTTAATMFDVCIKLYSYAGSVSAEIRLTFYKQTATYIYPSVGLSGSIWASDGFSTEAVNVGFDPTGKLVINIGEVNTNWGTYSSCEIERIETKYTGGNQDWANGWSLSFITDLTDYVLLNIPLQRVATRNWVTPQLTAMDAKYPLRALTPSDTNSIRVADTRNVNLLPSTDLRFGTWFDFKTSSVIGLSGAGVGTYSAVITMVPYSDNSGNSNTAFRLVQNTNEMYFQQYTTAGGWGSFNKFVHTGNMNTLLWAKYASGSYTGINASTPFSVLNGGQAQNIYGGGLLVSNVYSDATNLPANGIYSKGPIFTGSTIKSTSLAGTGTRMVIADLNGNLSSQSIPVIPTDYYKVRPTLLSSDTNNIDANSTGTLYYKDLVNSPYPSSQDAIGSMTNLGGKSFGLDFASTSLAGGRFYLRNYLSANTPTSWFEIATREWVATQIPTPYTHPNSGVTAGTYRSVTVNAQGHVTAGSNPTTLAGYQISDAMSTSHAANGITSTLIGNWNTAYGWGDYRQYGFGRTVEAPTNYDINTVANTSILGINDNTSNRPFDFGSVWTHRKDANNFTQIAVNSDNGNFHVRGWNANFGNTGWKRGWTENDFSYADINNWGNIAVYGVKKNAEFSSYTGAGLMLADDYTGGEAGLFDAVLERMVAGKEDGFYKYGSQYNYSGGLVIEIATGRMGYGGVMPSPSHNHYFNGTIRITQGIYSESSNGNDLYAGSGGFYHLDEEIAQEDKVIRLAPFDKVFSGTNNTFATKNRVVKITLNDGGAIMMDEFFVNQEITIMNISGDYATFIVNNTSIKVKIDPRSSATFYVNSENKMVMVRMDNDYCRILG
jgi:hypothetical protein